jgi:hypothetical protein
MFDKILKILTSRLVLLIVFFIAFVLLVLVILNSFYPDKFPFSIQYLYLLHFLVIYLNLYLIIYIWKTKDTVFDSRWFFLVALNLLIYTPFYLILDQKKIAEQLAIRAYYAMV